MKRTVLWVVFCMIMGCLLTGNCLAQDAAAFYKGKTIVILIPSGPGGTFDLVSRAEAPFIEKYTGARTLVQNSAIIQAQNILYKSKPDGLTIILCGHGPKEITAQLFKEEGFSFDWNKFTLLGRIPASSTAIVVDKKSGWTKPADLQGKAFFLGESAPFFGPLFAEALGWDKMAVIPGMRGSERSLAMRRGELQATTAGAAQVVQDEDVMRPIVVTTKDEKGFRGVPVVKDLALKGKEKWGRWASAWDEVMYWSYATPGIPQDRAAFLESALKKMFNDPAFVAQMEKMKVDLSDHVIDGKELKEITRSIAEISDNDIKEMHFVITQKYLKK
jgi:tripartite-type tricarboxylate transporter receptor subunit TctC